MPKFIAFEGIDGSGKTVQIDMMEQHIIEMGKTVYKISFPRYNGVFGSEIGKMLADKRHPNAFELSPKDISLWYALDRFDRMRGWMHWEFDYVLLNRFSLSNMAFQGSRMETEEDAKGLDEWLIGLENHTLGLPSPDSYIVFDVSPLQSRINVSNKGARDYVGEEADLHEKDEDFQARVRMRYRTLAGNLSNVEIVDCLSADGAMRSEEDIHKDVLEIMDRRNII